MYDLQKLIEDLSNRPYDLEEKYPFLKDDHLKTFDNNYRDLEQIEKNQYNPLNIVLMGEVKAGKSTLLNALAGEEISNVGVTETTAVILEVSYGLEQTAVVEYKAGTSEELGIEELNQRLKEKQEEGNTEFYGEIEKVVINYPLERLKELTIVDTPGVDTITSDNQKTTEDYIMKSDVVLWLINANHVGQSSIMEKIIDIRRKGKPVIIILNRLDQISEADRVLNYVKEEYEFDVDAVFGLSAEQAFQGVRLNNHDQYNESGLPTILDYLENNIEKSATELKEELLYESLLPVVDREIQVHLDMRKEIEIIDATNKTRQEQSRIAVQRTNKLIEDHFDHWINHQFLKEEENELLGMVTKANDENVKKKMKQYLSTKYITDLIEQMTSDLNDKLTEERKYSLQVMGDSIKEEVERIQLEYEAYAEQYELSDYGGTSFRPTPSITEGAKSGAIIGGTTSLAFATYISILGPAASYISFGTALGAYFPPALFAGIIGGVAYQYFTKDGKANDYKSEIIKSFDQVRSKHKNRLTKAIKELKKENEQFYEDLNKRMDKDIMLNLTLNEIKAMDEKIEEHLSVLEIYQIELRKKIFKEKDTHSSKSGEVIDLFD